MFYYFSEHWLILQNDSHCKVAGKCEKMCGNNTIIKWRIPEKFKWKHFKQLLISQSKRKEHQLFFRLNRVKFQIMKHKTGKVTSRPNCGRRVSL